mgnify:CR=1 FL=1
MKGMKVFMRSIFKKNQVIISVIALMLIAAGYMSYTTDINNDLKTAVLKDAEEYAELGDAQLVSSQVANNENIETQEESKNTSSETQQESKTANDGNLQENGKNENVQSGDKNSNTTNMQETNEAVDTSTQNSGSSYFTESRLEREKMYSQMLESYQKILENSQITDTQKEIAQNEVSKINKTKNAIMIAENLIKNKDFSDVVIFVNGNSVNVVVKEKTLKTEQIAQIQNIVTREIENDIENIHISCKE